MTNELPLQIDSTLKQGLQSQLFSEIRRLLLGGYLRPGTALPATRELASQLGVSRNTVLLAYERLIAEGYLESRPAIGTFVSEHLPESALYLEPGSRPVLQPEPPLVACAAPVFRGRPHAVYNQDAGHLAIDFKVGRPDPRSFPVNRWRRLLNRHLQLARDNLTEYHDPTGILALRQAIADHLGPARGITVDPRQVLVVAGCQEALNIIARLFVQPGTPVVTECPGYQGAVNLFESYGASLLPVPVDREGLVTGSLPAEGARLAYLTPSHQYPLGYTLSLQRRLELLEWAQRHGTYLVEDDYDSDFRHHGAPLTALKGLDRGGSVIYLGTFSKSIGAALRMGYMVLPEALVEPARTVKTLLNNGQPWLDQVVLAEFISSGGFANHLRRIRRLYLQRRDCLIAALERYFGRVELSGLEGGMHLAWRLPSGSPSARVLEKAVRQQGVGIYSLPSGAAFCSGHDSLVRRTLMLGYAALTESQIEEGVRRVAATLSRLREAEAATAGSS
ncbi:MAG: PLP-dependent aminotransferase family protein [Sedimenticola sp.]|nr:PLP-dependent aminotransferase family protein [Sedimenticola sp.]